MAILRTVTSRSDGQEAGPGPSGIQIRIEAAGLPGRELGPTPDFPGGPRNIHVGVQRRDRRDELLGLQPGDAASAVWTFDATVIPGGEGADVRGAYIQGRPGGRFIYLSWVAIDDAGARTMFMRVKLMLDAVDAATLESARRYGRLIARLRLTDAEGRPLCAAVRPPLITWSASPAG